MRVKWDIAGHRRHDCFLPLDQLGQRVAKAAGAGDLLFGRGASVTIVVRSLEETNSIHQGAGKMTPMRPCLEKSWLIGMRIVQGRFLSK